MKPLILPTNLVLLIKAAENAAIIQYISVFHYYRADGRFVRKRSRRVKYLYFCKQPARSRHRWRAAHPAPAQMQQTDNKLNFGIEWRFAAQVLNQLKLPYAAATDGQNTLISSKLI